MTHRMAKILAAAIALGFGLETSRRAGCLAGGAKLLPRPQDCSYDHPARDSQSARVLTATALGVPDDAAPGYSLCQTTSPTNRNTACFETNPVGADVRQRDKAFLWGQTNNKSIQKELDFAWEQSVTVLAFLERQVLSWDPAPQAFGRNFRNSSRLLARKSDAIGHAQNSKIVAEAPSKSV